MTPSTHRIGRDGEAVAAEYLSNAGFRVIDRNVRFRSGELDLVAYEGETLVFVEVKARRSIAFGSPQEAVDRRKQLRLARLAETYLARRRLSKSPCRFDLVVVEWRRDSSPRIALFRNAFSA